MSLNSVYTAAFKHKHLPFIPRKYWETEMQTREAHQIFSLLTNVKHFNIKQDLFIFLIIKDKYYDI